MRDSSTVQPELERLRAESARLAAVLAERDQERADSRREIAEVLEHQAATVGVLRAIATSPDDLQGILDTVVRQATELAIVQRIDGEYLPIVAWHARPGAEAAVAGMRELERTGYRGSPYRRTSISGTAFLERCTVHVPDTKLVAETFPDLYATSR